MMVFLKHACFILKFKDFCNTCVHFQWKKTNASRHDRDTVSAAHAWFAWQAKLPTCVLRVARIHPKCVFLDTQF